MSKKTIVTVATAYNIYEVKDEVMQILSAQAVLYPPAVVMETLVMRGLAKKIASILPYDIEKEEGSISLSEEYDPEDTAEEDPHAGEEMNLIGPWYHPVEEEEEEDDGA